MRERVILDLGVGHEVMVDEKHVDRFIGASKDFGWWLIGFMTEKPEQDIGGPNVGHPLCSASGG